MAQYISEIMPTIKAVAEFINKKSQTCELHVTDHIIEFFGKSFHRFNFKIINRETEEHCGGDYINIYMSEIKHPIRDNDVLERINDEMSLNYRWVIGVLESLSNCHVRHKWYASEIKIEDTLVKPRPLAKHFDFERKDDILDEYSDIEHQIKIEEKTLEDLKRKKIGLAKEYFNRKSSANVGDIVYFENRYDWQKNYGVITDKDVYACDNTDNGSNIIEKNNNYTLYVNEITSGGKSKKSSYCFNDIKRICNEKEFSHLMKSNGYKSVKLNEINVEKLHKNLLQLDSTNISVLND